METQESGFGYGKEKDEDDFAYEDEDDFLDDDGEIIESDNQLREGYEYVMPEAMINLLRDVERTDFEARGQQDAHEFLRFLLDKVNDCLHETAKHSVVAATELRVALERVCCESNTRTASAIAMPVDAAASDGSRVVSPAAKRRRCEYTEDDVYAPVPPPSPLTEMGFLHSRRDGRGTGRIKKRYRRHLVCDLFQGRAVTATRCMECECRTERAENFLDVSLPVAVGKTLSWAWSAQGARENMKGDNKYHCENCATYTEAERWWQISELPDVLTVHLKLFAFESPFMGNGGKVPVAMPCPLSMKLSEWCSGDCADRDEEYKLTGIIVHEGTGASSGHYYSYIYKGDKESWFVFDDASVTPVAEAEMKDRLFTSARTRRTAYLLFYTHHARIY